METKNIMIVNTKFGHHLPAPVVDNMREYLITSHFRTHVMEPYLQNPRRRFLAPITPFGPILTIQHSGWYSRVSDPTYLMTLTCVATLGLLDIMILSHEGTHDSSLLWLAVPKARIYKQTSFGAVICSSIPNPKDPAKILTNPDGLMILADQRQVSTVILDADAYSYDTY